MIELNGELIAEYLEERELYGVAVMLKRRADEESAEGPQATTFLAMAMAEPGLGRFGEVKPDVTGATEVPVALPAGGPWAGDPVGMEPPLGYAIDEIGAALGGAGNGPLSDRAVAGAPQGQGRREDRSGGGQ
jgi:hypothetical protein